MVAEHAQQHRDVCKAHIAAARRCLCYDMGPHPRLVKVQGCWALTSSHASLTLAERDLRTWGFGAVVHGEVRRSYDGCLALLDDGALRKLQERWQASAEQPNEVHAAASMYILHAAGQCRTRGSASPGTLLASIEFVVAPREGC